MLPNMAALAAEIPVLKEPILANAIDQYADIVDAHKNEHRSQYQYAPERDAFNIVIGHQIGEIGKGSQRRFATTHLTARLYHRTQAKAPNSDSDDDDENSVSGRGDRLLEVGAVKYDVNTDTLELIRVALRQLLANPDIGPSNTWPHARPIKA
jgi:hypothetical protein